MTIIKKIILYIITFLKKIFGFLKPKKKKKVQKEINKLKISSDSKKYNAFIDTSAFITMPPYLIINGEEKKALIEKILIIEEEIKKINDKDNELLLIEEIKEKINHTDLTFYEGIKIDEKIYNVLNDKDLSVDTNKKIVNLKKETLDIISSLDKDIQKKTIREYKKINYVTLTNVLLDDTFNDLRKLGDNIKNHRYNKYYYERELTKIKKRIDTLKKLREKSDIEKEIINLKKDMYTKSKDKYDLLYNEEVFINGIKICDDLLKKVNKRVIDIKKEETENKTRKEIKKEKKEEKEKLKEEEERYLNILKRFQDMELARRIIFLHSEKEVHVDDLSSLFDYMNNMYYEFLNGEDKFFNFDKNREKTEVIKLCNSIIRIKGIITKEKEMPIEHINYQLDSLLTWTKDKKEELDNLLISKYNYQKEKHEASILVDNKLYILLGKKEEKKSTKVLEKELKRDSLN